MSYPYEFYQLRTSTIINNRESRKPKTRVGKTINDVTMSNEKQLTFEEVNAHIEKHFTADKRQALNQAMGAGSICNVYHIVRPILVIISSLPLIPSKWKDAVKLLIGTLDAMCPGN